MNTKQEIICDFKEIPFEVSLSFNALINNVKEISKDKTHPFYLNAADIVKKIEKIPELNAEIQGYNLLKKHNELINQMMSFVINPLDDDFGIEAVYAPFDTIPFFANKTYFENISNENLEISFATKIADNQDKVAIIFQAFLTILKTYYDFNFEADVPFTYKIYNILSKEETFYKKKFDLKYLSVTAKGEIKTLRIEEIYELFDNATNLKMWNDKIPLDNFKFSGFIHSRYVNVTHDYVMSELKSDLIDKNTILSKHGFNRITEKVRVLIDNPHISFGIASTPATETGPKRNEFWKNTILRSNINIDDLNGSIYQQANYEKQIVITKDFKDIESQHIIHRNFLALGFRSHAVVPLFLDEEMVGMMEFACEKPNAINMFQIMRLHDVFPIFALALKRSREEWNDKLQAIIQNKFTAIHSTVEWRFREVAADFLSTNETDRKVLSEPILFDHVFPLYGASDIRSSSLERNKAIRLDLREQLNMALNILLEFGKENTIPIINDLVYKIKQNLNLVKSGLNSGDEVSIVEFMKNEITPVFDILKKRSHDIEEPINAYFSALDPELGVLYKKRKDFEDSVTLINNVVSEIIDTEQSKAQEVFPHYFEKYRTDGIEYNAYIGQSLVNELEYNDIYLRNLRLWQLLTKVKVARKIKGLQATLKTKLDITQLILIHSNPLSIEFRQDEKKFDVAGTYNIRYEITKKRIDKALIKGTQERVTQVGKIAIVYSHSNEISEYKKFIDYMISQGFITNNVEYLELEDLKGASGLNALRIEVNFDCHKDTEVETQELIESGL